MLFSQAVDLAAVTTFLLEALPPIKSTGRESTSYLKNSDSTFLIKYIFPPLYVHTENSIYLSIHLTMYIHIFRTA